MVVAEVAKLDLDLVRVRVRVGVRARVRVTEVVKLDLDLRWREHGRAHELLRGSEERMSCLRESPYARERPKRITLPEPGARLTEPGARP